ncbi:Fe-S oxidoreductase [Pontibacillus halophilus JSM 076056 = DSM 19796]|uniref:Fe-S oxidoreductase n=2 Tax=Pontibacillus TaxID=289201 RepID=A0A0A5I6Z3_9BACI|nr:radical SAM protein [Pontibacillus halophilus]KGX91602.1 Fe-S oxidoreductase [Pontibacillus halophilus JSM 076056 = DSM 19796]
MKATVTTLNAKYIHKSLALRYLKSAALPDHHVTMKEFTIHDEPMTIAGELYKEEPEVIGFSCYIWNIEETIPILSILRKVLPNTLIVLGGPEVTYDADLWMERLPDVDVIVRGEGEDVFKTLLSTVEKGTPLQDVKGITYRQGEHIRSTVPAPKVKLQSLSSPYRFEEDKDELCKRIAYIETSRGCPYTCQFCLSSIEVGVRYFDIDYMKEEITYLMSEGARTFKFLDRTFNINRSYALEMFQFLIKNHLPGTVFQFEVTGDIMRPEVIDFINTHAPPGLFRFEIGVQSTNEETNELIQRRQNFIKLKRTIDNVRDGGKVVQHVDLIAGLPQEDYASFRETFNEVFGLRPDELQLGFLKMLRGTGLRRDAAQFSYQYMDHAPYEMLSNHVLSFQDVLAIKQVEDILEKYWNKHFMDRTIGYLVDEVFKSPFDFFQQFGLYWHDQGFDRIGHQLNDLYKRLSSFLSTVPGLDIRIVEGLMHLDYYSHFKQKPRQSLHQRKPDEDSYYEFVWNTLPRTQTSKRQFFKHACIHPIAFRVDTFEESGQIIEEPSLLVAWYGPEDEQVTFHHCPPPIA